MICVLGIVDQRENWGRMVRVFKPTGSRFETQIAGDACRKHFPVPRKEVGMDRDFAKAIDEEVATMGAEDGKVCSTHVDFAREVHEEDNVPLEISRPPAFLLHRAPCAVELFETPAKGKVKQMNLLTLLVLARQRAFGSFTTRSLLVGSSCRNAWLLETRQSLSHDDHCFQSQGLLWQKHLSQLRNEQVGAAILFESLEIWPSLRMLAHVATAAAQSGFRDAPAAAQRLPQNDSEMVEQSVADFSDTPMVISADESGVFSRCATGQLANQVFVGRQFQLSACREVQGTPNGTRRVIMPLRWCVNCCRVRCWVHSGR